jgi:malonyl-CoA/methylmalonyl-CoA synthetase
MVRPENSLSNHHTCFLGKSRNPALSQVPSLTSSRYLHNEKATKEAHDENGYFKTGDIGRREGDMFFITGRASVDILKSGGYKISAIEIERALMELPYVKEVAVIGVADDEYGQRVGAMLVTQGVELTLTLDTLRKDLTDKLAKYKMPTLLRLFNGELPKGPTGKVQKKVLGEKYFPSPGWEKDSNVQALNTEAATKAKL